MDTQAIDVDEEKLHAIADTYQSIYDWKQLLPDTSEGEYAKQLLEDGLTDGVVEIARLFFNQQQVEKQYTSSEIQSLIDDLTAPINYVDATSDNDITMYSESSRRANLDPECRVGEYAIDSLTELKNTLVYAQKSDKTSKQEDALRELISYWIDQLRFLYWQRRRQFEPENIQTTNDIDWDAYEDAYPYFPGWVANTLNNPQLADSKSDSK